MTAADTEQETVTPQPYEVFLVEDHATVRRLLYQLLEREKDMSVVGEAATAEEALQQLERLSPDLLTVDLSLPGMSGLDLIQKLKAERPELRCLVVTGQTDIIYQVGAELVGAVGYVAKDDPNEVVAAVRAVLGG